MRDEAKFVRYFMCKKCQVNGDIELVSDGFSIVSCPQCTAAEIWGEDSKKALELFLAKSYADA